MLLPVLAPEGEPGFDSLVNFRPGSGESRVAAAKTRQLFLITKKTLFAAVSR